MTAVSFSFVATIGRLVLGFLATTGRVSRFTASRLRHCVTPPWYPRLILRQMVSIGYFSLLVVRGADRDGGPGAVTARPTIGTNA